MSFPDVLLGFTHLFTMLKSHRLRVSFPDVLLGFTNLFIMLKSHRLRGSISDVLLGFTHLFTKANDLDLDEHNVDKW